MKKIQALLVLVLSISLFVASPSFAADKSLDRYLVEDVSYEHSAYKELSHFLFADIIDGNVTVEKYEEDGEIYEYTSVALNPQKQITRAQFTKILVNALNLEAGNIKKTFSDVKSSSWYYEFVQIASSNGIIQGKKDGTFKPNDKITRAQMASMIYRAFENTVDFSAEGKTFKDVSIQNGAYDAIVKVAGAGIVKGYGDEFRPAKYAIRSHAVLMIDRAMHLEAGNAEEEETILAVVEKNITEEIQLVSGTIDVNALDKLYRDTTTGYLLASSLEGNLLFTDPELEFSATLKQIGTHTTSLASLNKRFASVKIDNLVVKVTMSDSDMEFSMNVDISGTAYLKKMADGSWKIYHVEFDDEDLNLQ